MTRQEFIKSENMTGALRDLLENSVLKDAIDIIRKEGAPRYPQFHQGDLLHQAALNGAKAHGWDRALFALETLAEFQPFTSTASNPEYEIGAIERLKASGIYSDAEINDIIKQTST